MGCRRLAISPAPIAIAAIIIVPGSGTGVNVRKSRFEFGSRESEKEVEPGAFRNADVSRVNLSGDRFCTPPVAFPAEKSATTHERDWLESNAGICPGLVPFRLVILRTTGLPLDAPAKFIFAPYSPFT